MFNSIFQQINKSCLHYPYSVEFYVYIRRIHFNGLAMMLRFSIFTTRRNIYMLYWMHLRYVDLYFLFLWKTFIIHNLPVSARPFGVLFLLKQFNNSKRTFSDCFLYIIVYLITAALF